MTLVCDVHGACGQRVPVVTVMYVCVSVKYWTYKLYWSLEVYIKFEELTYTFM